VVLIIDLKKDKGEEKPTNGVIRDKHPFEKKVNKVTSSVRKVGYIVLIFVTAIFALKIYNNMKMMGYTKMQLKFWNVILAQKTIW